MTLSTSSSPGQMGQRINQWKLKLPLLEREKSWQGQPRQISLGKNICQISNLKKLKALRKFKQNFSPFKNPLYRPGEETNHVEEYLLYIDYGTPKLLTALSWEAYKYLAVLGTKDTLTGSEFILYSSPRDGQNWEFVIAEFLMAGDRYQPMTIYSEFCVSRVKTGISSPPTPHPPRQSLWDCQS